MSRSENIISHAKSIWGELTQINPLGALDYLLDQLSAEGRYMEFVEKQGEKGLVPVRDAGKYIEPSVGQLANPGIIKEFALGALSGVKRPIDIAFFASDFIPASWALTIIRMIPPLNATLGKGVDEFRNDVEPLMKQASLPAAVVAPFQEASLGDILGMVVVANNVREGHLKEALLKTAVLLDTNVFTAILFSGIAGSLSGLRENEQKANFQPRIAPTDQASEDLSTLATQIGMGSSAPSTPPAQGTPVTTSSGPGIVN